MIMTSIMIMIMMIMIMIITHRYDGLGVISAIFLWVTHLTSPGFTIHWDPSHQLRGIVTDKIGSLLCFIEGDYWGQPSKVNTQAIGSLHSSTSGTPQHARHNALTQQQLFKATTAMSQSDHNRTLSVQPQFLPAWQHRATT